MFSLRPGLQSLALLFCLVPSLSVFAQQEEEGDAASSLLMTNYNALREEGQGFYLVEKFLLYEKPDSVPVPFVALAWWCELDFLFEDAADTTKYGYIGKAVEYLLGSSLEEAVAQGAEIPQKIQPLSVSAVLVPTLGLFEGQSHATHDDWIFRFWDDGNTTLPILGWEAHDEGDTHPNSDTCAVAGSGTFTKITAEAAAKYIGMDVADMTPATCSQEYKKVWEKSHALLDPIVVSVAALEEKVAQQQADINELLSRMAATEGATGSGSGADGDATSTASTPFMAAWYEHDTLGSVAKAIMTASVIIGLVAVDFIF